MNNDRVPIWIADYVLTTYGTGAIMGVPAHDTRDFDFVLNYGLPILPVIDRPDQRTKSFALGGTMNDGFADALRAEQIPFEEKQGSLYVTIPPEKMIATSRWRNNSCARMRGMKLSARVGSSSFTMRSGRWTRWKASGASWRVVTN